MKNAFVLSIIAGLMVSSVSFANDAAPAPTAAEHAVKKVDEKTVTTNESKTDSEGNVATEKKVTHKKKVKH